MCSPFRRAEFDGHDRATSTATRADIQDAELDDRHLPADPNPKNDPFNFSLNVTSVQDGSTLTSAVQQYNRTTKSYGNYTQFPTSGGNSLPAYYDLKNVDRDGNPATAVLCSFDGAVISSISSPDFPNRYRVSVTSPGAHTLQVYQGSSCPTSAGTPMLSQPVMGVTPTRVSLASGSIHSLALKADGTVRSWGNNRFGQLGNGTTTSSNTPVLVAGLTDVVSLAGGVYHSLALKSDGTVSGWGDNANGQLGNGTTTNSSTPVAVMGLSDVVAIAAGDGSFHSLALRADGTVRSWGYGGNGELGNSTFADSTTPVAVTGLTNVVGIAGGSMHSLALKVDGTVLSWGDNGKGQLGDGTNTHSNTSVPVKGLADVVSIAGGNVNSLALKADGTVRTWGENSYGQLGNGTTHADTNTPVSVTGLTDVVGLASSGYHSLALRPDGTVRSWGANSNGQLGNSTTTDSSTPVLVPSLTEVVGLAGGDSHSLALMPDGTLRTWGRNSFGTLGNGTTTDSSTPVTAFIDGVAQPTP